eukprot:734696-Amphidinium_carterae.1
MSKHVVRNQSFLHVLRSLRTEVWTTLTFAATARMYNSPSESFAEVAKPGCTIGDPSLVCRLCASSQSCRRRAVQYLLHKLRVSMASPRGSAELKK